MTCRQFRRKHGAYLDDTLSGVDLEGMVRHRALCEQCSQLDTRVRRALLVARNIPTIEPSPAFAGRLQARLMAERMSLDLARLGERQEIFLPQRALSPATYAAIAAIMIAVAGLAGAATATVAREDTARLNPVIAASAEAIPAETVSPKTAPSTTIAVTPAETPLWPAAFADDQAAWHFASDVTGSR
jgi:hypothetical protein